MADEEKQQVKSRDRVRDHGEVFMNAREVKAMLDLVQDECANIDSTFLEPACGDGNFLAEILRRKLAVCQRQYGQCAEDYEKYSFLACTTLYGVDILSDNVMRCRDRLFATWADSFTSRQKSDLHDQVRRAVQKVLEKNILLGNALLMKLVDAQQKDLDAPIVFTEWKFAVGDKLKRAEYRFDVLLEKGAAQKGERSVMTFDFLEETSSFGNWMPDPDDPERKRMIPAPFRDYPLVDYWRLADE